jgi:hypothetical protein
MDYLQFFVHYGLHFIVPLLIAYIFFKPKYLKVYLIFLAAMLIDLDHLIATPIFDPDRCSVGFHLLHSYGAIAIYGILLIPTRTRIIGLALLWHILTDTVDCWMMHL